MPKQDLDTPLSVYLRATYDLPLPARFYDPKTLKPIVRPGTALVTLFEKGEGNLNVDDIAAAYILEKAPVGTPRKELPPIVEVIKTYGAELSTRFGIEKYVTYSTAQLEADRATWQGALTARKEFERFLSKGIDATNEKISGFPAAELTRPEVQQSNLVFTRIAWNADGVDLSLIRDRDTTIQPIIDGARLTNEDAPDIFTLIPVTGDPCGIPYLGFHTPLSDQFRVATTTNTSSRTTIKTCAIHPDKDEYTYKTIGQSDLYSDLRGSTCFLSFMIRGIFGLLDLSHSSLILNRVTNESEQRLTEQVGELFPFLKIDGLAHRRITARILAPIGGVLAYHVLFFDTMINQGEYIGYKEEDGPQLLKPTRTLYLSPIPRIVDPVSQDFPIIREIHVVLANRVAANSELVSLERGGAPHELKRGTAYVEFMVYDVSDSAMLKFTSAYLSRMMGHYYDVAVAQYAPFIAAEFKLPISLASADSTTDAVYARSSTSIRGIDIISHTYPEVFGHNYTRQCPNYPVVKQHLDPGDVEYHPHAGGTTDSANQWLRYPPDGGIEFYFRCGVTEPEFPHPGIKISKLKNRTKYPLLPCCFRTTAFKPGHHTEVAYRLGSAKASAISSIDITVAGWGPLNYPPTFNRRLLMSSEKTLYRGRLGRIPESLMSIISTNVLPPEDASFNPDEEDSGRRIVRLGLSETNMVHACFLAVDKKYQKLATASLEERLAYLRREVTKALPHPACLYQELGAREASREVLLQEPLFEGWTTTSHYRILEEILDINLYVFIRVTPRENVPEPNHYFFEVPTTRSGAPHARRHSMTRSSVLLYRVRRFEGDVIVDAGVELLMQGTPFTPFSGVWGTACSPRLAELYTKSAQVLSFGTSPIDSSMYVACIGLNTADYASTLTSTGASPISQLIDERGLCRALTFEEECREGCEHLPTRFSVVFPATQPYNLPFSAKLEPIAYDPTARRIFGDACMTSMSRDGVFYLLGDDPTRYIFVPLVSEDASLPIDISKVPYTPLTGLSPTAIGYAVQWRTANTYLRVLLFVASFLYAFCEPRDPSVFVEKYILIDASRHASQAADIYDLSGLKRVLVLREPVMAEALATIKRLAPSLLDAAGERLVVTSQKIFEGLKYYIRTVHDQTIATPLRDLRKKRWDLARVIAPLRDGGGPATMFLTRPSLKEKRPSTLNFGSAAAVRTWFRGLRSGATSGGMQLATSLAAVTDTIRAGTGVVLWRHPNTNRVWLIPGITDSLRNAAAVGYLWTLEHRVVEFENSVQTAAERAAIQSRVPVRNSRLTAMFREHRRSRSQLVIGGGEEDLSSLRHLLDSADVVIVKYVITRDNRIELLTQPLSSTAGKIVIEVLRTGPERFTPMLSP